VFKKYTDNIYKHNRFFQEKYILKIILIYVSIKLFTFKIISNSSSTHKCEEILVLKPLLTSAPPITYANKIKPDKNKKIITQQL